MAMFIISYDLHRHRDYRRITEALTRGGADRLLESLWLWNVNDTAVGVRDTLRSYVDGDDSLAVIELKRPAMWATWRVRDEGLAWLKRNIPM